MGFCLVKYPVILMLCGFPLKLPMKSILPPIYSLSLDVRFSFCLGIVLRFYRIRVSGFGRFQSRVGGWR